MNMEMILNIIELLFVVVMGFLSLYLKQKNDIMNMAKDKISEAEEMYKDVTDMGGEKFNWVVDTIYGFVPIKFRPFFTKEAIGVLVQKTFDGMERYCQIQLDKAVEKVTK